MAEYRTSGQPEAHLYELSVFGRARKLVRERGFGFFVRKSWTLVGRMVYAATLLRFRKAGLFTFRGRTYRYFCHPHNFTWDNERAVEIPIALEFIEQYRGERILEVGNVLSHYVTAGWDIVDKFERGPGIVGGDAVTYRPPEPYDLIISVSTLEHVGFDDDPRDTELISRAVENLRQNCLKPGGKLMVTVPIGYNPHLDELLFSGALGFTAMWFLKRTGRYTWQEASADEVRGTGYATDYIEAGAVAVAEFET
ncbi:class I SAM-dependent methyltransferase [Candidatus Latescibacterota bacterium]